MDQANRRHPWELILLDADGAPAAIQMPDGDQEIRVGGEFEVGRPPGIAPGTAIDLPLAINIGPLPLTPGARYAWRITVDGETREDWQLPFSVRRR